MRLGDAVPGGDVSILEQVWAALDANVDPIDTIITSGQYRVFVYFGSHDANSWKPAANSYTVPVGKKLLLLHRFCTGTVQDTARDARFFNVTDATEIDKVSGAARDGAILLWTGDVAVPSKFPEIAAGKEVRVEIWNSNTSRRAMGVVYVCREVGA